MLHRLQFVAGPRGAATPPGPAQAAPSAQARAARGGLALALVAMAAATALAGLLGAPGACAATVEGVELPAWSETQGQREPLLPGASLDGGTRVFTGPGGRVLLRLEEGSLVRLGENARLDLQRLEPPAAQGGVFRGFLNVLEGAFRFTTTALSRPHRREVDIRIVAITAGVRGTDVWGKAAPDRDIVCLIEGQIQVQREGDAPFAMDQPLSFYIAPKDSPALPVGPVDPGQLARWAAEVELEPERGALGTGGGRFEVVLQSHREEANAARARERLRELGYPADNREVRIAGKSWQRLSITGFESAAGARAFADRAGRTLGLDGVWVRAER